MSKVRIVDIKEHVRFVSPEKSLQLIDVTYETAKGFRGTVRDLPADADEELIWEAIGKATKTPEKLLGMEKEL